MKEETKLIKTINNKLSELGNIEMNIKSRISGLLRTRNKILKGKMSKEEIEKTKMELNKSEL